MENAIKESMQPQTGGVCSSDSSKCTLCFYVESVYYAQAHILDLCIDGAHYGYYPWMQHLEDVYFLL